MGVWLLRFPANVRLVGRLLTSSKDACPTCGQQKSATAKECADCYQISPRKRNARLEALEEFKSLGKSMFPGKSANKLTNAERGELWAAVVGEAVEV